jgi:hypothetical protein
MNFCLIVALKAVAHSQSSVNWLRAMQFWLYAMQHSMESWLHARLHSAESWLHAMLHSVEFFSPRIADKLRALHSNLISIENSLNKNSTHAIIHSGESWLVLCSIAHIREYLREFETELENILGYYSEPRENRLMKNRKSRETRETISVNNLAWKSFQMEFYWKWNL